LLSCSGGRYNGWWEAVNISSVTGLKKAIIFASLSPISSLPYSTPPFRQTLAARQYPTLLIHDNPYPPFSSATVNMSENGAHKDDEQLDVAQDEEMHDEASAPPSLAAGNTRRSMATRDGLG
jgi:hypothetical protein